jgi:hypothetical protein
MRKVILKANKAIASVRASLEMANCCNSFSKSEGKNK